MPHNDVEESMSTKAWLIAGALSIAAETALRLHVIGRPGLDESSPEGVGDDLPTA